MTQTYLVCSACGTTACAEGRVVCDQARTAPLIWADTPYPKDEK